MSNLEIIDILCDVTTKLSELVDDLIIDLGRTEIESGIKAEVEQRKKECDDLMETAGQKLRRIRNG